MPRKKKEEVVTDDSAKLSYEDMTRQAILLMKKQAEEKAKSGEPLEKRAPKIKRKKQIL